MNLRFAARGQDEAAMIHLAVTDTLHFGHLVRKRGEALCRAHLPNLDILLIQIPDGRSWCNSCIDALAKLRVKRHVNLPTSAGLVAADLIRKLRQEREAKAPPRRRRKVMSLGDK